MGALAVQLFLCFRLYDSFTGEFVWECDEHEGSEVHLLSPPMSCQWCGFYSSSGVWVLRSRRLVEQAQLMAQALFPITTNADEVRVIHVVCFMNGVPPLIDHTWRLPRAWANAGCQTLPDVGPALASHAICT